MSLPIDLAEIELWLEEQRLDGPAAPGPEWVEITTYEELAGGVRVYLDIYSDRRRIEACDGGVGYATA